MDIQAGIYANFQKVLDENGKEVLRRTGGGSSVDLSAYPTRGELDRRLARETTFYVGGSGASDTLVDGRGLVPELPFERLSVAVYNTLRKNSAIDYTYIIQGDIEDNSYIRLDCGWKMHVVKSEALQSNPKIISPVVEAYMGNITIDGVDIDNTFRYNLPAVRASSMAYMFIRNCNIKSNAYCLSSTHGASLRAENVSLDVNGSYCLFTAINSHITLSKNITMNGTCNTATISSSRHSDVLIETADFTFAGSITGRKYRIVNDSKLILNTIPEATIPGTIAGTCDESSMVVAV